LTYESRERLLAGADRIVARTAPFETVEAMFAWASDLSGRFHRSSERVRTRKQIAEILDNEPEPSPTFLALFEATVRFSPYLIGRLIVWMAEGSAKRLECNPKGPKLAVPSGQREDICAFIGALYARGVSLKDAQNRAADRWDTSQRSIERVWSERGSSVGAQLSIEETQGRLLAYWHEEF